MYSLIVLETAAHLNICTLFYPESISTATKALYSGGGTNQFIPTSPGGFWTWAVKLWGRIVHLEHKTVCKVMNLIVNGCILFKLKSQTSPLGEMLQCLCSVINVITFQNNESQFPKMFYWWYYRSTDIFSVPSILDVLNIVILCRELNETLEMGFVISLQLVLLLLKVQCCHWPGLGYKETLLHYQ